MFKPTARGTSLAFCFIAALASAPNVSADWREYFGLSAQPTERPPQFVALAFDGSLNNSFWEESLTFGKENSVPFTYFASGVYFLLDANKATYTEPSHGVGKSAIGWGGTSSEKLIARMGYLRRAYAEGNEIGSHANGHFDGSSYSYDQWKFEFSQFPKLIFDAFANNKIIPPADFKLGFGMEEVKGFRAPLLGQGPPLYDVLSESGFHYDTSKTAPMGYWPQKIKGLWNYPLANVGIAGTAKRTLSMDYNFYFSQSGGVDEPNPDLQRLYGQQMLQTYFNYFMNNYNGNRAPVHIGHHFAKWNGSAYWNAMKEFARTVCHLPEVRCVTYRELTDFMESRTPAELEALSQGAFPKAPPVRIPPVLPRSGELALSAMIGDPTGPLLELKLSGADAAAVSVDPAFVAEWKLDGAVVGHGLKIPTNALKPNPASVLSASIRLGDVEILRTSRKASLNSFDQLSVEDFDLESRTLRGDLPEAHRPLHRDEDENADAN